MPRKSDAELTEAGARAELAAGRPVPLEWLWILGDARIQVVNEGRPGKTLELEIRESNDKTR